MKAARRDRQQAAQLWRLCLVDGLLDGRRARQVVERVIESHHSRSAAVLSHFVRLVKHDCARHTARVESAMPFDADLRAAIEQSLSRQYGPALTTMFTVEPALIGGMRVTIGSDVYDGSVQGRLEALAARFQAAS